MSGRGLRLMIVLHSASWPKVTLHGRTSWQQTNEQPDTLLLLHDSNNMLNLVFPHFCRKLNVKSGDRGDMKTAPGGHLAEKRPDRQPCDPPHAQPPIEVAEIEVAQPARVAAGLKSV